MLWYTEACLQSAIKAGAYTQNEEKGVIPGMNWTMNWTVSMTYEHCRIKGEVALDSHICDAVAYRGSLLSDSPGCLGPTMRLERLSTHGATTSRNEPYCVSFFLSFSVECVHIWSKRNDWTNPKRPDLLSFPRSLKRVASRRLHRIEVLDGFNRDLYRCSANRFVGTLLKNSTYFGWSAYNLLRFIFDFRRILVCWSLQ